MTDTEQDNITKALDILTDVHACIYTECCAAKYKFEKEYMNFIMDEITSLQNIIEESHTTDWEDEDDYRKNIS